MCQYSEWSKGYPCRGGDYPDFMQGAYLPGDEPGWRCSKGDYCDSESCPFGEEYWEENGEDCYPEELCD